MNNFNCHCTYRYECNECRSERNYISAKFHTCTQAPPCLSTVTRERIKKRFDAQMKRRKEAWERLVNKLETAP